MPPNRNTGKNIENHVNVINDIALVPFHNLFIYFFFGTSRIYKH